MYHGFQHIVKRLAVHARHADTDEASSARGDNITAITAHHSRKLLQRYERSRSFDKSLTSTPAEYTTKGAKPIIYLKEVPFGAIDTSVCRALIVVDTAVHEPNRSIICTAATLGDGATVTGTDNEWTGVLGERVIRLGVLF